MRLCFVGDAGSIHLQRWAKYFSDRGHEIHIISYRTNKSIETYLDNIKVHSYPPLLFHNIRGLWRMGNLLRRIKLLYRLRVLKLIHSIDPDIVHLHYLVPDDFYLTLVLFKMWPLVVSPWGSDLIMVPEDKSLKDRKISKVRLMLEKADLITASSNFLICEIKKYLTEQREVKLIPFGVDLKQFKPKSRANTILTIGVIKHLEPVYGIEYLLRAVSIIVKDFPNIKLLIIGSGFLEEALKKISIDLKIDHLVEFRGAVPHPLVPTCLSEIDIFAMPSISEGLGVAALEAQAMEIPVVASNVGGIPEAVIEGETGILVPPKDPEALAGAILVLLKNPQLRQKMGQQGRKFVFEKYNCEKHWAEMEKLYQLLILRYKTIEKEKFKSKY